MEELKPCPFCGGKPDLITVKMNGITDTTIGCWNEDCFGQAFSSAVFTEKGDCSRQAIAAWNRRSDDE